MFSGCSGDAVRQTNGGGAQAETDSVQQATDAYWLARACDSRCAEPTKTRPPSYVPVTLDCRLDDRGSFLAMARITAVPNPTPVPS
jgi:hypothetical protein